MDLKTFVSETMKQIADGVREGDQFIVDNNLGRGLVIRASTLDAIDVEFDIAVTVTDVTGSEMGGGIQIVKVFSVEGKSEEKQTSSNTSRIKFQIPLQFHSYDYLKRNSKI